LQQEIPLLLDGARERSIDKTHEVQCRNRGRHIRIEEGSKVVVDKDLVSEVSTDSNR
jgi:hypothetical protein